MTTCIKCFVNLFIANGTFEIWFEMTMTIFNIFHCTFFARFIRESCTDTPRHLVDEINQIKAFNFCIAYIKLIKMIEIYRRIIYLKNDPEGYIDIFIRNKSVFHVNVDIFGINTNNNNIQYSTIRDILLRFI